MGSIDTPTFTQNGSDATVAADGAPPLVPDSAVAPMEKTLEIDSSRKRRFGVLPLEVGTRVMCRWRDGKYHPVKVIERRKIHGGANDYEYYVHYTECKLVYRSFICFLNSILMFRVRVCVWCSHSEYQVEEIRTVFLFSLLLLLLFTFAGNEAWFTSARFWVLPIRGFLG